MSTVTHRTPGLLLAAALVLQLVLGCSTMPDNRAGCVLNMAGFDSRYTDQAADENWVAIGDSIRITDEHHPDEIDATLGIDIDGTVWLPGIGAVEVAGLTSSEIEARLLDKYSPYYELLDIRVEIITPEQKYFVFGEVADGGERAFPGDLTVFEAVMSARPDANSANLGHVRLIRGDPRDPSVHTIDVGRMLETGDSSSNVPVHDRDILVVPPRAAPAATGAPSTPKRP